MCKNITELEEKSLTANINNLICGLNVSLYYFTFNHHKKQEKVMF